MASINLQSNDGSRSPARAPWSKIVAGESSELPPPAVSPSILDQIMNASTDWYPPDTASNFDDSGTGCQPEGSESDSGGKKPVWSKPSNGVVEAVSPVMGAVSWPALGESTKAALKSASSESSPSESLHTLSDGSLLPIVQVTANSASSLSKPATVNPVSTPNHVTQHSGQRSMKRGGGNSGAYSSSNAAVSKPDTVAVDSISKESPRGVFGSQTNSYRRGNGGPYSRGRGNQEWNQNRNFNNNMQSQRGGYRRGSYTRPSVHNSTSFMQPPMRPFGNNIMYPDVAAAMVYYQGPVPPMVPGPQFFPFPNPLHGTIVKQIEYYFSNENLVKDTYLRRNMDENGWVSVNLIAGFKKVSCLTDNVQLILDVMRQSTIVEVQGEKMRRRNDWMRWLMPPAVEESLASQFQGVGLGGRSASGGGERAAVA